MAEIRTTRMRLVQWTEGTDSPQRVDFNETFLNIETLAAIDQQGAVSNRPTPNKTGMYYFATDEGILYRADGLAWAVVGSSTLSHLVRSARVDAVSFTVQAITGQTADLLRVLGTTSATLMRIRNNGDLLMGAVRISQAARTTTAADAAPSDSAVTVDNNSTAMWGLTAKNTTGNTAGYYRAVRGTSTVFSVAPDGSVTTPAVTLSSAPTDANHAVRKTDLDTKVSSNVYDINGANISGTLSVARGGTGGTTEATARAGIGAAASATAINTGNGLTGGGNLTANRTLSVVFPTSGGTRNGATTGTSNTAARMDHQHSLAGADIVGVLPVAQGGTNLASANPGAYLRANTTGDAYENITPAGLRADIDAATSGHGHSLTDANITGILPVNQGGTGATTAASARAALEVPVSSTTITAGVGLTGGGNLTASRTLDVVFAGSGTSTWGGNAGTSDVAARYDHSHSLSGDKIVGTLPIAQGGTGATTVAAARTALSVPIDTTTIATGDGLSGGGNLTASRTISVTFAGSGTATTVARSDHGHALTDANITGTLPISQGGTNATTVSAARSALGVPYSGNSIVAGNGLTGGGTISSSRTLNVDFAGNGSATTVARSDHSHAFGDITGLLTYAQIEKATPLGGTEDLNTYTSDGAFHQASNSGASGGTNYPTNTAGLLLVKAQGSMVYQLYWEYSSTGRIYYRTKYGTSWYSWKQLATTAEIDNLSSVYAPLVHGHSLTDANITGTLPLKQGGTGATTAASARSALAVPSTSVAISAGAGLSGGGTLAASRTLQVVFEGSGTKTTSARSDHGHALTDANITGTLPATQGGTGLTSAASGSYLVGGGTGAMSLKTPAQVLSDIGASPSSHGHSLTDSNITGTLPVNQGGTGSTTAANALASLGALPRDVETFPANQNINNWTKSGWFVAPSSSQATSANGYPASNAVFLIEHQQVTSNYATQTAIVIASNRQWRRATTTGSTGWSSWAEILDTDMQTSVSYISLPSNRLWPGHGLQPHIVREGKRRTIFGRVGATGTSYFAATNGEIAVCSIPSADAPKGTMGWVGTVSGFVSVGTARFEMSSGGNLSVAVSQDTNWVGFDGFTWYLS